MHRRSNEQQGNQSNAPHVSSGPGAEPPTRQGNSAQIMAGQHLPSDGEPDVQMFTPEGRGKTYAFDRPSRTTPAGGWIPELLDLLHVAHDALPKCETRVRDMLVQAAALIHSDTHADADVLTLADRCYRSAGLSRWQAKRVNDYIDAHVRETIRMRSLASVTKLSTSYFFHAFRATFGESPYRYVVRRRIELAKGLMMTGDRTLADIALECGFADQPHMTRLFRKFAGVPPAAWRRAWQTSQDKAAHYAEDLHRKGT